MAIMKRKAIKTYANRRLRFYYVKLMWINI